MAILIMTTAIIFLTAILADFTFETTVNKIKVFNVQDKSRAKINAEAGLRMAMARLKIYKEARNALTKNAQASAALSPELLNVIWSFPFAYPIPIPESADIISKNLVEEFAENSVIDGSMQVFIANSSDLLNINLLRVAELRKGVDPVPPPNGQTAKPDDDTKGSLFIEEKLTELLTNAIEKRKEEDETFELRYGELEPSFLIKTIKFYISDKNSVTDTEMSEISSLFERDQIEPKYAPLSSISEIYMLPGWDDEIVDLIKNEITVHGELIIDLNKINENTLQIIFPTIEEEQIKEFFEYRDDPADPHYFNKESEFRSYIVNVGKIVGAKEYNERIGDFKKAGIKFGTAGSLFRVLSTGEYGRAKTTLTAYVSFPLKIPPTPTPRPNSSPTPTAQPDQDDDQGQFPADPTPTPVPTAATPPPEEFLEPRILEILID